jgi:hypothetical protein
MRFIWKHRLLSAFAALLALTGGVALAAWLVFTTYHVNPSTFNTGAAQTNTVQAFSTTDCTTLATANIWPSTTAAGPGTVVTGALCLENDSNPLNPATFTLTGTNTNATLAAGLTARVTTTGTFVAGGTGTSCTFPTLNADGTSAATPDTQLYVGPLSTLAVSVAQSLNTTTARRQRLCFSVVLPTNASTTLAGLSNNFDLSIVAGP